MESYKLRKTKNSIFAAKINIKDYAIGIHI